MTRSLVAVDGLAPAATVFIVLLCGIADAGAQDEETSAPAVAACGEDCWDFGFLSVGRGTLLGTSLVVSATRAPGDNPLDVGLLTSYRAEVIRNRELLSQHILVHGALGAGTAEMEGRADAAIDMGLRVPMRGASGGVLRLGPAASVVANGQYHLSLLKPLRLALGYHHGLEHGLFEVGLTTAALGAGRHRVGRGSVSLSGALASSAYATLQFERHTLKAEAEVVQPGHLGAEPRLFALRALACGVLSALALCADVGVVQGALPVRRVGLKRFRSVQVGLTAALTP